MLTSSMTRFGFLLVLLSGCFAPLDNPDPNGSCASHADANSCTADGACEARSCPACNGALGFAGCYARGHGSAACPEIKCASACSSYTDQASCDATPGCASSSCLLCDGSSEFAFCYDTSEAPPPECELPDCPVGCDAYKDDASCSAQPGCFSVFEDPGTCDCSGPGCCMQFASCATGPAMCGDTPSCTFEPVLCADGFTLVVINGCADACARISSCTPPPV